MTLKLNDPMKALEFFEAKMSFTTGPAELQHVLKEDGPPNIVDVRAAGDYADGHIPGAVSLPEGEWFSLKGLSKNKVNIVYCYTTVCHLAARAAVYFASKGYAVMELDGGYESWTEYGYEVERGTTDARLKDTA